MDASIAELSAGFDGPFAELGQDAARDRETVVISWPSVPVEIVRAAGLRPVVARARAAPTPAADAVLEPDLFPNRHRQLVEAALTGRLANVAAIVLPRTSEPDYKCFLYLRELVRRGDAARLPPVLLFDLLQSQGPDVLAYDAARAQELLDALARLSGRRFDLQQEIAAANRARAAARSIHACRGGAPRVAGAEALPLLGAFWQVEPARYAALAAAAANALSKRPALGGPRVLCAGAPVDSTALVVALEREGAVVVGELSPFGSGAATPDVEAATDPLRALVGHYRRESVDQRRPVAALMEAFDSALDDVGAVVISLPPEDSTFGWDYPRMRDRLARRAIPHAVLRGDPALALTAEDRERVRALLRAATKKPEAAHG